ncbi:MULTISPECIES: DUF2190 family protein [unclassified Pseudacidovorax]|uniref:DUF2190 family protein n=1 Tax=unclassified Pseudacidovorax TaxID=2620592 RepID=UPI001F4343FE|nr:DUF2190 family protein [Pseudacidovorax sp. NFM-22]
MKNYVQPGDTIEVSAAAAAVDSGDLVVIGSHLAVANHGAAVGEPFNAKLSGVFELPKVAGAAWTRGQQLMWDASAGAFVAVGATSAGDVTGAGATAWEPALAAATVGLVRLAGIPGTVAA